MNCLSATSAAALVLLLCSAAAKQTPDLPPDYSLAGSIEGLKTGWVYLRHMESGKIDSVKMTAGKFAFTGSVGDPEYCWLGINGPSGKEFRAAFFLEKGKLTVRAQKDSMGDAIVSGTPVQDEYRQLQGTLQTIIGWPALNKAYDAAKAKNNTAQMDSLHKVSVEMNKREAQLAKDYIKAHPSSYVSALFVDMYFTYEPDPAVLGELYNGLDRNIQASYFGREVKAVWDAAVKTAVGQMAPVFQQNDVKGRTVDLSSFRGQYVLVDFWASWCGPCRAENPAVVKAYQAYHSKGFSILGVSLDDNKEKWLAAIKKDGLTWTHVSDLKGWLNSAAVEYGVKGIPMNFLLDKEGRIVAKGLRGEELEQKLAELVH